MKKEKLFALRCYVNGRRKFTKSLTVAEARIFRHAALHLAKFLNKEYRLRPVKTIRKRNTDES